MVKTAGLGGVAYTAGALLLQAGVITPGLEQRFTHCGSWVAGSRGRRVKPNGLRTLSCFYPISCSVRIYLKKEY